MGKYCSGFFLLALSAVFSCASQASPVAERSTFSGTAQSKSFSSKTYPYSRAIVLSNRERRRLGLNYYDKNIEYVRYHTYTSDFIKQIPQNEKLHVIGKKFLAKKSDSNRYIYDVLLVLEAQQITLKGALPRRYTFSKVHLVTDHQFFAIPGAKDPSMQLKDFTGDGIEELFLVLNASLYGSSSTYQYYLYNFAAGRFETLLRPWDSFSSEEQEGDFARHHSAFFREKQAKLYPAFIAQLDLEPHHLLEVDLSFMADVLVEEQVYSHKGLVLRNAGIPHLDFHPILYPVQERKRGVVLLRSVQQLRSRYGQIGILIADWHYSNRRWFPVQGSIEFLRKPRI